MAEIRKADPLARRRAALIIVVAAVAGALLLGAFEHYRAPLSDWFRGTPTGSRRVEAALVLITALLCAPLLAFAAYLWFLGGRVLSVGQWPPPGLRVIRDTLVVDGEAAERRGHALKALAVCLGVASCALCLAMWYLAVVLR